jgi:hypothetical protein
MSLSGVFLSLSLRRSSGAALILVVLLMLSGCWVYSVEPLYEAKLSHPDPELAFESSITGAWLHTDKDNGCIWTLSVTAEQQVYDLTMTPASTCQDEKITKYEGHLLKLGNHRFLDVAPNSGVVCDLCLPLHSFFLISQENDTLELMPLSEEWLRTAIAQQKVALAHLADDDRLREVSNDLILTASSKDLKAFVLKYADDKAAFIRDADVAFKRK